MWEKIYLPRMLQISFTPRFSKVVPLICATFLGSFISFFIPFDWRTSGRKCSSPSHKNSLAISWFSRMNLCVTSRASSRDHHRYTGGSAISDLSSVRGHENLQQKLNSVPYELNSASRCYPSSALEFLGPLPTCCSNPFFWLDHPQLKSQRANPPWTTIEIKKELRDRSNQLRTVRI